MSIGRWPIRETRSWRRIVAVAAAILAIVGSPVPPGLAIDEIFVTHTSDEPDASPGDGACATAGGACTLRAAIQEANASPGTQSVNLAVGLYRLSSGVLSIDDDIALTGASGVVVDGNGQNIFSIGDRPSHVTITSVTLRNAATAILVRGGGHDLSLVRMTLVDNDTGIDVGGEVSNISVSLDGSTVSGGGTAIHLANASASVRDSRIVANSGLGIDCSFFCQLSIARSVLSRNGTALKVFGTSAPIRVTASDISLNGIGILNEGDGDLVVEETTIRNNTGDGIELRGYLGLTGAASLFHSRVIDNGGRGINGNAPDSYSAVDLTRSIVSANGSDGVSAALGVSLLNSTVSFNAGHGVVGIDDCTGGGGQIVNSTVSSNQGDGIVSGACRPRSIHNSTIANNRGHGIVVQEGGRPTFVGNSIVAGNLLGDCSGAPVSEGYNLIQDASGCSMTGDAIGNVTGVDPQLGPLDAPDGWATPTHALLAGSPAIDAGNPSPPGSGGSACEPEDQRLVSRLQGTACDIGAYELTCGNEVIDIGEECDDGGRVACDGCSPNCRVERCGNGVLDCGETCDEGDSNGQPDAHCTATCQIQPQCIADVDGSGTLSLATDIVYMARRLLGLSPVPPSFRVGHPEIPADEMIAGKIDGLCPHASSTLRERR